MTLTLLILPRWKGDATSSSILLAWSFGLQGQPVNVIVLLLPTASVGSWETRWLPHRLLLLIVALRLPLSRVLRRSPLRLWVGQLVLCAKGIPGSVVRSSVSCGCKAIARLASTLVAPSEELPNTSRLHLVLVVSGRWLVLHFLLLPNAVR